MTNYLESLPASSIFSRIRRNHGLEHAAVHLLSQKNPGTPMGGRSDAGGFWLIGNLDTDQVKAAVAEALSRMKKGEKRLAVHPNCGTNIATAGSLAGMAGMLALLGVGKRWQDKLDRLPLAMTLGTLAMVIAQPLGTLLQAEVTTSGLPGTLTVTNITRHQRGRLTLHRVETQG